MPKADTIGSMPWRGATFSAVALFVCFSCSQGSQQAAKCASVAAAAAGELAASDYEVDYKAFNSTFLKPDVARLYGIDPEETLGVVMVSVFRTDSLGIGVESCVNGGVKNLMGQENTLDFDEIREGRAIYHIGTFDFIQNENFRFNVDVVIAATGKTHKLKWQQKFWEG